MKRTVAEVMTRDVAWLPADATMEDAVLLSMRKRIRHIPIVENDALLGILTDRDLKRAMPSLLSGQGRDEHERVLQTTKVSQLMTKSPLTVAPETPLREAVSILVEKKFGALPVVSNGRLIGIVSEVDLLRVLLELLA